MFFNVDENKKNKMKLSFNVDMSVFIELTDEEVEEYKKLKKSGNHALIAENFVEEFKKTLKNSIPEGCKAKYKIKDTKTKLSK